MPSSHLIPDNVNNLADFFEQTFARYADLKAFSALGQEKTFAEIDDLSSKFGAWLQHNTTLQPGDRVAIQLPNIIQNPVAILGALRAGFVVVGANPMYTPSEMAHQFNDSGAKVLVILEDFLPKYEKIKAQTAIETVIVTTATQLLDGKKTVGNYPCYTQIFEDANDLSPIKITNIGLDDTAVLQYTGGTTGVSKGAELTHSNILSNCMQTLERLGNAIEGGKEIAICPLPLYHIYAFTACIMCFFSKGALSVLVPNPRDMDQFIGLIKPYRFTALIGLNTLFVGLCAHPEFKNCNFNGLKLTTSAGSALTSSVAKTWHKVTDCSITEAYGLSETSPVLCLNQPGKEALDTVGMPVIQTDIKILDQDDRQVTKGQEGQIAAKGPQIMKGYWQRPEETANVMTHDGYIKTGDIGKIMPDGCIKIVDRLKDMVIVSGFNVYPNEIEEVLSRHPNIIEAAVIGKLDDRTQESLCAYITVNAPIDTEAVKAFCRTTLTAYKIPKEVNVIDELPKSAVGKVLRRKLRG